MHSEVVLGLLLVWGDGGWEIGTVVEGVLNVMFGMKWDVIAVAFASTVSQFTTQ